MNKYREFTNESIKDVELVSKPSFYTNTAGNPYVGRLRGINVKSNTFKREKTVEFDIVVNNGGGQASFFHYLGYKPFVVGSYVITQADPVLVGIDYPANLRGTIPESRYPEYGTNTLHEVFVTNVTENLVEVSASIDSLEGEIRVRLHLLREPTV